MIEPIDDTSLAGLRRTLAEMEAREWGRNIGLDTVLALLARLDAVTAERDRIGAALSDEVTVRLEAEQRAMDAEAE